MKDYFQRSVVGQQKVRRKLSYYLDVYYRTNVFRNCLFIGEKGSGKTKLCRKIGECLGKPYVEFNASTIGSVDDFFDQIWIPHCLGRPVTLMFDEIHAINKKMRDFLLSVLAPNKSNQNTIRIQGGSFVVDFRLFTFLAATTETNLVFDALRNRLENISLIKYSKKEIKEIVELGAEYIDFTEDSLDYLVSHCKLNARSATELGVEVKNLAMIRETKMCDMSLAVELIDLLDWYENGLSALEIQILRSLENVRASSLTRLAARHGLSNSAMRNLELELLSNDLMEINNGRRLTMKGREYLTRNPKESLL